MTTITIRLNDDDQNKLHQLLAVTHLTEKSTLIRMLINNQWLSMQAGKTFLERRGGPPKYFLSGTADGSSRSSRKAAVAAHLEEKAARRRKPATK